MLDDRDRALLALLRDNARMPTALIARRLGLARSTVQERIARLERRGVIRGYTIREGAAEDARLIRAHVMLSVDPKKADRVAAALRRSDALRLLAAVSGPYDMIAVIAAETTGEIDAALDAIGRLDGVERTVSSIVLSVKVER